MPRRKAATPATDPNVKQENGNSVVNSQSDDRGSDSNGEQKTTRKRVVPPPVKTDPDEPTIKRGRAAKSKAAEKLAQIKQETSDEKETGKAKKGRAKKKAQVKNEDVDDSESTAGGKGAKKGRPKKTQVKKENDDPSSSSSVGKGKKSKQVKEEPTDDDTPLPPTKSSGVERVVVVSKGRAPVDALCPIAKTAHVLEEDEDIWDCMLNQTNIQFNNNKYYLIQILKDDSKNVYSVWMRWGRVGANGQNSLQPCGGDLGKAKKIFMKKFSDKTRNEWDMRDFFEKVPGKYDLLAMDYATEDTTDSASKNAKEKMKEERKKIECKLDLRVKALIELLCDVRIMEATVMEMKYDAAKAPLGKLTTEQIRAGYAALKKIDELILQGKYSNMQLVLACNDFYTRIPHYFGMKVPPLIKTKADIQEKVALLEALGDIQAALSVIDQPIDVNVHPVDQHYIGLKCEITPLDKITEDYKVIENYLLSTHGKTHTSYKLELVEAFVCKKDMEYERFKDVGNRMLLWHGSRLSNWAGILSQGLRIAPPEAPVTGYMFGKGIYFADMSSKSANYCWATQRSNIGFLALSEVALGKTNDLLNANYNANKLPSGCNSVKGLGRTAPDPQKFKKLSDGLVVPMGPGKETKVSNSQGYSLLYNEYIVYDPAQVRTRFLLKVKFNFR
ncbi:Poly [ADP-ribose] polymerase 2 [Halocaridina rubra]|uniref:Poly [ADP-ribose] polymerase n=1 Tax=Halocaridina rubra TaxID=373956 RepID=A0AAN8XK54_HALRR